MKRLLWIPMLWTLAVLLGAFGAHGLRASLSVNLSTYQTAVQYHFYAAFGLGLGETTITSVDANGVALAAIQGLSQLANQKDAELRELRQQVTVLKQWIVKLAAALKRVEEP